MDFVKCTCFHYNIGVPNHQLPYSIKADYFHEKAANSILDLLDLNSVSCASCILCAFNSHKKCALTPNTVQTLKYPRTRSITIYFPRIFALLALAFLAVRLNITKSKNFLLETIINQFRSFFSLSNFDLGLIHVAFSMKRKKWVASSMYVSPSSTWPKYLNRNVFDFNENVKYLYFLARSNFRFGKFHRFIFVSYNESGNFSSTQPKKKQPHSHKRQLNM